MSLLGVIDPYFLIMFFLEGNLIPISRICLSLGFLVLLVLLQAVHDYNLDMDIADILTAIIALVSEVQWQCLSGNTYRSYGLESRTCWPAHWRILADIKLFA